MNPFIVFKYTSRSRPLLFFRGLDSIVKNIIDKESYHVLCSFDVDDQTMNNQFVINRLNQYPNLSYYFGNSKNKIDAINRDLEHLPEVYDILVNMSDDQIFTSLYFDRVIRAAMQNYYPDFDGVPHFPDQTTGNRLITMSIMGRAYFERFNYIYHPAYISLYADNEFGDTAKILNKYTFIDVVLYHHLHPAWGLAPLDEQYVRTEGYYNADGETYILRKSKNFEL